MNRPRSASLTSWPRRLPIGLIAIGVLLAQPLAAADLRGTLNLTGKYARGRQAADLRTTFVWFTPDAPVSVTPPEEPYEIVTVRKEFTPRTLAVPVGSTVRFPNQDPILHNVFSVSDPRPFDLGLYRQGEGGSVTFDRPGVVRIYCNVHQSMVAYVLVLETPHSTRPGADGSFRLDGLPPGPGTLTVWHERGDPVTRQVTLPSDGPLSIAVPVTKPRVPRHLNKRGKPYQRKRGKRY